jgi:hypothetical protein
MFDLTKWWHTRTTNRPLRFSNRAILSFENLETRTLLSSGVIQATIFEGPLSAVAIVAEPINLNATSAESQQTLSDVVPGGTSSRVLPTRYENAEPASRLALPDPFGLRMLQQLDRMVMALMNFEMGLLNGMTSISSSGQALETPGLNTGNAATATADGMATIRITAPLQVQSVTDPGVSLNNLQLQITNPNTTTTSTAATTPLQLLNQGNSNGLIGPEAGGRQVRAPIQGGQNGNTSNGNNGPLNQQAGTNTTPPNAPPTILPPDLARNAAPGVLPTTPTNGILPGQGTAGGTLVGGQLLLPGVVTTPTPSQQIQAGILNTADPYARFEQTILTKEGFKTASGEETPVPPQNKRQANPARAFGAFEEEENLDLLDPTQAGSEDQAALHRHKADTFFVDSTLLGEDQGWAHGNSIALAGAMLIIGGFWGAQMQKTDERKRRQSVFATLRKWLWR